LLKDGKGSVKAALTGGIASGKSTVAALMECFGAKIIDFDLLAREALEPGTDTFDSTLALFGPKALLKDGRLDRALMAKRVFKDPGLRRALEDIVHPFTWKRMLGELGKSKEAPLTVMDVPLLYEAGLQSLFPRVILCFAAPGTQVKRLLFRNPGLSQRQAKRILANQLPMAEKLRHANIVLNNDGGLRELIFQTKDLYLRLTGPDGQRAACGPPLAGGAPKACDHPMESGAANDPGKDDGGPDA
jgi:dephospho-CoA kinase